MLTQRKIIPVISSLLALLGFSISIFLLAIGCGQSFGSNGQRIYFNSESASGQPITYTGGPGVMMRGKLACVNCHGTEGHGGRVNFMMQSFDVPNITWPELISEDPPFTEETLKRAITQGIEPDGGTLKYPMPRWQISAPDLIDLVSFIKTLK